MKKIHDVQVQRINNQTENLKYGTDGAACFDLVSNADVQWSPLYSDSVIFTREAVAGGPAVTGESIIIGYEAVIPTGYRFEIPEYMRMDIYPRSGWGFKHNIQLANGTGKIDSDYRGEVFVKLIAFNNLDTLPCITKGSRIAQAEINPVYQANFNYVETLSSTERGEGGFGSTGV